MIIFKREGGNPLRYKDSGGFMFKKQLAFQKIVCLVALLSAVLVFVYAISILTDVYDNLFLWVLDDTALYETQFPESRLIYDIQPFNNEFVNFAVWLIVISLTLFITCSNSRRNYYISNYVSIGVVVVANIAMTIWALYCISYFKGLYTSIDFETLRYLALSRGRYFSTSTFWFDISYFVFAVLIIATGLLVANLIWKIMLMKNEKKLINESSATSSDAQEVKEAQ